MNYLSKIIIALLIAYNWPWVVILSVLDTAKIDLKPQKKGADFSTYQYFILFLIASFFSTLAYIVFWQDLVQFIKYGGGAWIPTN